MGSGGQTGSVVEGIRENIVLKKNDYFLQFKKIGRSLGERHMDCL